MFFKSKNICIIGFDKSYLTSVDLEHNFEGKPSKGNLIAVVDAHLKTIHLKTSKIAPISYNCRYVPIT